MKGLEGYGQNRDSIRCEHVSILQSKAHTLRLYPEECLPLGARDMVSLARPQPSQNTGRTVQRPHGEVGVQRRWANSMWLWERSPNYGALTYLPPPPRALQTRRSQGLQSTCQRACVMRWLGTRQEDVSIGQHGRYGPKGLFQCCGMGLKQVVVVF